MAGNQSVDIAEHADLLIVGGGLSGCLIALAMAARRPETTVTLIERGETLGGRHVWSFFASDIAGQQNDWIDAIVSARWQSYSVHFPGHSRHLDNPYRSITAQRLDATVRERLPADRILTGETVEHVAPQSVRLAGGRELRAGAVIDARGLPGLPHMAGGWQKFMGQTLRLLRPHGLHAPVVMDARVDQTDGYRFVYCLPFSADEIFVEDTYYTHDPALDRALLRERIARYADAQGWQVGRIEYEETGVLPVIAAGDFPAFWNATDDGGAARAGTRALLLHPLTSYSFPDAVRMANRIAGLDKFDGLALGRLCHAWSQQHWRQGRFYRMLTRMLFAAARPAERYRVLERFYRLPAPLIERFYAGASTPADMIRILSGKPPVPLFAALSSLTGGRDRLANLATALRSEKEDTA